MGFTEENFPQEREVFWRTTEGKVIFPGHSVAINEWWPAEEEADLVYRVVLGEQLLAQREALFGSDATYLLYNKVREEELYSWLTNHMLKDCYTNDYCLEVTESMVLAALEEFDRQILSAEG